MEWKQATPPIECIWGKSFPSPLASNYTIHCQYFEMTLFTYQSVLNALSTLVCLFYHCHTLSLVSLPIYNKELKRIRNFSSPYLKLKEWTLTRSFFVLFFLFNATLICFMDCNILVRSSFFLWKEKFTFSVTVDFKLSMMTFDFFLVFFFFFFFKRRQNEETFL